MSRCTIPALCAFPRASAICAAQRIASSSGNPFGLISSPIVLPSTYSITMNSVTVGLADVIDGDDVGVVQGGCGFRFVDEPLLAFQVAYDLGTENLEGHRPIQTHIARAIHFPHPAHPDPRDELVCTETSAERERHWVCGVGDSRRSEGLDSGCFEKRAGFVVRLEEAVDLGQERRVVAAGLLEVSISVASGPTEGIVEKLPHPLPAFETREARGLR